MADVSRKCAACGTDNEEDARFCDGCGGSLARVCGACGVEARSTARFCRDCGASLEAVNRPPTVAAASPVRRTVTVMFADLAGSTSFEERVDAETAREVIGRYHDLLRSTAQRHRAGVTKYIGDGFMAVWGVPETGPEDASRAVEAAVELQDRFVDLAARVAEAHGVELALRVAVNTGEVVVGVGDADLVGDALNVGARLEAECPRGDVVVGEETWRSTRSQHRYEALGQVQVKGRTTPVAVFQWLGHQAESADAAPFVGRADEVRRLHDALDDATRARAARMVTVIGDPGVGKTRLAAEFVTARPSLRMIRTRCNVEETVALAPIVELLRSRDLDADVPAGVPERERMLRDLKGLADGVPGSVEETFWALRRFVEALAHAGPLLIVLDDLQWADTLLLDFVEHLVEWVAEVPVLVLALARPELRELRPDFVAVGRWVAQAVHLGGLNPAATAELAAEVLGGARLPQDLLLRLPSSTGGNPLFVRELIGMLVDDEVLVPESDGWRLTIDVDAITIPPTIHALLASRLERLDTVDRRVLEIASVFGTDFSLGAVSVLAERGAAAIKPCLDRLRRLQLAQPSGAYVGDEPVWRFHHVLIRDVAYRRLLKSDRADLHERLADWVEAGGATLASDPDEMIARHLESAHGYRLELGTLDDHAGQLALRSARRYLASARRALDRDELVSAGSQAARGAALATADDAVRAELLLIGCEAFLSAGDVVTCAPLVDDLERIAGETLAPWATCYRSQFVVYTDPERLLEVDADLQDAIDEFGRRNDEGGLAKAHRVRAGARARLGRIGDCEADLLEALIAARRSGDQRQITAALSAAPSAALWGPSPVPKAGGRCLDVVRMQRMATAAPSLEATSLRCLAVLELLRGRPDKARTMMSDARQVVADLGLRHGLMETELFAGIIESMVGDPVAAEPHFRAALEGLGALGVGADAGLAAALLARALLAQGQLENADAYAGESERLAGHNLKTAVAWRAVRSEILCAQGSYDEAVALARDAVAIAAGTDLVLDHADACLALGRVLTAAGDVQGGDAARRTAEALYTAKEVVGTIGQTATPAVAVATPPVTISAATSRLPVTNLASETSQRATAAMTAHDIDGTVGCFSDRWVFDDRRGFSGDPIGGSAGLRIAIERILAQYSRFEGHVLAVRGERLHLARSRWSDDSGNETTYLHVYELDDDGRIGTEVRFDEDDFEGAYRELDERYYAGEGAAFAVGGAVPTEWMIAWNRGDFDRTFDQLATPEFRLQSRSRSVFGDRSATELRASVEDLSTLTESARVWISAIAWLSPTCVVSRFEREAVGLDGERYSWTRVHVAEVRDGRIASMCDFDPDAEDDAFAFAEELVGASANRLPITNRASEMTAAVVAALQARDVDGAVRWFSDGHVVDERRRWLGPIRDFRTGLERILEQYRHVELRTLAVRGKRLHLCSSHWSDDSGNETTYLHVFELGQDGRISHEGRFDEDDFEDAVRELERRYYAGEGAEFAVGGALAIDVLTALNRGETDRAFGELVTADFRATNRSRSVFGDRSAAEFQASIEELGAMVASVRVWHSAVCWLSPTWVVFRSEREAVGFDGERYTWTQLYVTEHRNGRVASSHQFELENEKEAFAFAEEGMRATAARLAVTNRASETWLRLKRAMEAHDVDATVAHYCDGFVYDDRRAWSGDPIQGTAAWRAGVGRFLAQYSHHEGSVMAVRGARLALAHSRWSDGDGNETIQHHVIELRDDGRIGYQGRFDEDDFEGAYRELESRYYASEGAAFAAGGLVTTEFVAALGQCDFDRAFGELCTPEFRLESRSHSVFGDRSAAEVRASFEELAAMITSSRGRPSAVCWLSSTHSVGFFEREAVGLDGEQYAWTWLYVVEVRNGRITSMCEFDQNDEDAAFAYAEERIRATSSRLPVTNRASETSEGLGRAMVAHDIDAAVGRYSDRYVDDDRRAWSGDPIEGGAAVRAALERALEHYPNFEGRTLAVRGDRLTLGWARLSDDAGNETVQLDVFEIGDDGRVACAVRFDADDFEGAYRELERRYYTGEGAAFAESGAISTEFMAALTVGDFDRAFGELCAPEFVSKSRSGTVFGDRSAAQMRASNDELSTMVSSVRSWVPAICWLSPNWCVIYYEREAVGLAGEHYSWTRLGAVEIRHGQVASICDFDPGDEEDAFAYAEEKVRATATRLAVTNRASEAWHRTARAMKAHDVDSVVKYYADGYVYDDRRGLSGDPIVGGAALRAAAERVLEQYSHIEGRTLAVRGETLALVRIRWSDDDGNETRQLQLYEIDDDGRVQYEGRFDEDDFEGAYRELDRRYYAGEGAAFAAGGAVQTEAIMANNRGDLDRFSGELATPDFCMTSRSRSPFGNRSAAEFRASVEELAAMVASAQTWYSAVRWLSPNCNVVRMEREAVGLEGEQYAWTRIYTCEIQVGRIASMCEFELDDEDAAFAYAEDRMAARPSRLAVSTAATETERRWFQLVTRDGFDSAPSLLINEQFRVVDRRAMPAAPCVGREAGIAGVRRLLVDYPEIDVVPLAVRGQHLALVEWRCRTPDGFEATYLNVHEFDEDGLLIEQVRFDGDDFEDAYRELEQRYYAGDGAAFAAAGAVSLESVIALNRGDFDTAFGDIVTPDYRVTSRSRSVFGDRSAAQTRASLEELAAMVASVRMWFSAVHWLSPMCCVVRQERQGVGSDGEHYRWTRLYVCEFRDGLVASMCQFELENEDEAFTYAEELVAARPSRLAVANLATERERRVHEALGRPEFDSVAFEFMHEDFRIVDRRAMPGDPFSGREKGLIYLRRLLVDYPDLDIVPLVVRGDRLAVVEYRGRTTGGYEATYLNVNEVDGSGQLIEQVRFDGDDFEGAYRELEQRYYAGEGAEFAAGGAVWTEYVIGVNRGDLDRVFIDVVAPDFRLTSRSRSVFGDRSAAQYRASIEELAAMVTTARSWVSALNWLSPTICVVRTERNAVGLDGEAYSWTRLFASEVRGGLIASACEFEFENEDEAFAYAEELAQCGRRT